MFRVGNRLRVSNGNMLLATLARCLSHFFFIFFLLVIAMYDLMYCSGAAMLRIFRCQHTKAFTTAPRTFFSRRILALDIVLGACTMRSLHEHQWKRRNATARIPFALCRSVASRTHKSTLNGIAAIGASAHRFNMVIDMVSRSFCGSCCGIRHGLG